MREDKPITEDKLSTRTTQENKYEEQEAIQKKADSSIILRVPSEFFFFFLHI